MYSASGIVKFQNFGFLIIFVFLFRYHRAICEVQLATLTRAPGCREQPPRGAPWVSGLVGHFVQTWPDGECSHTVQFLDCTDLN